MCVWWWGGGIYEKKGRREAMKVMERGKWPKMVECEREKRKIDFTGNRRKGHEQVDREKVGEENMI